MNQGNILNFEVGALHSRKIRFKSPGEWIFFKVFFKDDMASKIVLNVFVNGTRKEPPFTMLVSSLSNSNTASFFRFLHAYAAMFVCFAAVF